MTIADLACWPWYGNFCPWNFAYDAAEFLEREGIYALWLGQK
jgi:hypothetical protein